MRERPVMYSAMRYLSYLLWILGLELTTAAYHLDAAIGFSLELDYATASIQFANGSSYNVVKLEGGTSYKETMRRLFASDDRSSQDNSDFTTPLSKSLPYKPPRISLLVHLQTILDHVWPGKPSSPTSAARPLLWMLKALKAATETYLEEPIQYIEVANPLPLSLAGTYVQTISSATSSLGLSLSRPYFFTAAATAKTCNIKGNCDDWSYSGADADADADANDTSYRLFVAVNHNRAAFTVSLMIEGCNATEELGTYHNRSLGSDSDISKDERYVTMKHALQKIVKPPYHQSMFNPGRIQDVILFGEATEDAVMQSVLKEMLGNELNTGGRQQHRKVDPLFAASRGVAIDCLDWDIGSDGPQWCPISIPKESAGSRKQETVKH